MAPAQSRENVAVFNPLVLALPNWHPDGPDGEVDGFVIPFVMPGPDGDSPMNRGAKVRVYPTPHGWRAELLQCHVHAETGDQARAFAGAWIRAAEVLDNVTKPAPVVDAGIIEDDEDQGDELVEDTGCRCNSFDGNCPEHGPR